MHCALSGLKQHVRPAGLPSISASVKEIFKSRQQPARSCQSLNHPPFPLRPLASHHLPFTAVCLPLIHRHQPDRVPRRSLSLISAEVSSAVLTAADAPLGVTTWIVPRPSGRGRDEMMHCFPFCLPARPIIRQELYVSLIARIVDPREAPSPRDLCFTLSRKLVTAYQSSWTRHAP